MCGGVRRSYFYDEQRVWLDRTYRAGTRVRLTVPPGSGPTVIDLLDSEPVGRPRVDGTDTLKGSNGADHITLLDGVGGDTANGGNGTDTCQTDTGDTRVSC